MGYLKGGFDAWKFTNKEIDQIHSVSAEELAEINNKEAVNIIDARKASEYSSEHVLDAMNAPLDFINDSMTKIDKDKKYYVHCASGYRSMVFISILKARGYNNLIDVTGGFNALKASNLFKVTDYVCPSTLL